MKSYSCLAAALAFAWTMAQAPVANAAGEGEAHSATLVRLQMSRTFGNKVFIHLAQPPSVRASCSTDGYWHFTLSLDDAFGKNIYAQLLVAYAQGQRVHIGGLGVCNEYSTAESIAGFALDTGA